VTNSNATQIARAPLPGLAPAFSIGIHADIDGDPAEDRALSNLLTTLHQDIELCSIKREQLYGKWIELPSVTLEQGVWLLLGYDPLPLQSSSRSLRRRFRWTLNRLECEVVLQRLRPVGKAVAGFARRFPLSAIAAAAKRVPIEEGSASQILELIGMSDKDSQPALPYQTERLNQRLKVHSLLVNHLRTAQPGIISSLAPKCPKRHREKIATLNVQIAMREFVYDEYFLKFYEHTQGGAPDYPLSAGMLRDDRDRLNVKFKGGRPKKSSRQASSRR